MSSMFQANDERNSLSDSRTNHRVRWGSLYISLPFPYKQYGNLPKPGDVREITFQIGVDTKAGVEIGGDQKSVARVSNDSIEYLRLRGTWQEECTFNVYVGKINPVLIYRQFCIKVVCDGLARPSPPEITTHAAGLGLGR